MQFQSQSMHSRHTANSIHAPFPTACATLNATTSSAELENMPESILSCVGRKVCLAVVSGVSPIYISHFTSLTYLLLLKLCWKTCWMHLQSQLQVTQLTITNMTVHMQFSYLRCSPLFVTVQSESWTPSPPMQPPYFDTPKSEPCNPSSPDIFTTGGPTSFPGLLSQPCGSGSKSRIFPLPFSVH